MAKTVSGRRKSPFSWAFGYLAFALAAARVSWRIRNIASRATTPSAKPNITRGGPSGTPAASLISVTVYVRL
jgi:hypothetical protein